MHQYVPYIVLASVLILSMLMTHQHAVNLTTYRNLLEELKQHISDTMAGYYSNTPDPSTVSVSTVRNVRKEVCRLEMGISDMSSVLNSVSDKMNEQTLQFLANHVGAAFILSQYEMERNLSDFMYNRGFVLGFKALSMSHPDLHKAICPYVVEYLREQSTDAIESDYFQRAAEYDLNLYVLGGDLKW